MNRRLLRAVSHDTGDGNVFASAFVPLPFNCLWNWRCIRGDFLSVLPFELSRCDSIVRVRLRLPARNVISSHFFHCHSLNVFIWNKNFCRLLVFASWDYVSSDFHVSKSRLQSCLQLSVWYIDERASSSCGAWPADWLATWDATPCVDAVKQRAKRTRQSLTFFCTIHFAIIVVGEVKKFFFF